MSIIDELTDAIGPQKKSLALEIPDPSKGHQAALPAPKEMPTYGSGFVMELMRELTGPIRRATTLVKTAPKGRGGVYTPFGFEPLPDSPGIETLPPAQQKEHEAALKGLELDIGLTLGTGLVGKAIGTAAAPVLRTLARTAPATAKLAAQAGRSALSFAELQAISPSDKDAADASERIKSIATAAGMGALFVPLAKLLAPLGTAVQGFIHALRAQAHGDSRQGCP